MFTKPCSDMPSQIKLIALTARKCDKYTCDAYVQAAPDTFFPINISVSGENQLTHTTPSILITPIALHQISPISRHPGQKPLSTIISHRPPHPHGILPLQAKLHMRNSKHQERRHGVVQHLPIGTVEFGDCCQDEGQGHALDEVVVGSGLEEEWVGVFVGGGI